MKIGYFMNLIKPKKLQKGDTIGIIAPSGNVNIEKIQAGVEYFKLQGYKVKLGKNLYETDRYLAGTDKERLDDLHNAFLDDGIDAIVCARGGYGALRLINKIDYDLIRKHPKIFCGFSDVTVLNALLLKYCGLITFSAPMIQSDFSKSQIDLFTEENFYKTLTKNFIEIKPITSKIYKAGNAEGILFGGNLSTIVSLCGQDFIPDEEFMFFVEDLNEPVYKIDKYITQLLNVEKFKQNVSAIVLGEFLDVDEKNFLEVFFENLSNELNVPVIGDYPFTHGSSKVTVPYGAFAKLENDIIKVFDYLC
jgi:muramoyltetrapeptide carboxypeptidase